MKWHTQDSVAANATRRLPALVQEYFEAGREVVKHKRSPKELHGFRVRTKRFRYALEMFEQVYGPDLDRRLAALQHLQKLLGKISDVYTIRELLKHDGSHKKELHEDGKVKIAEFRDYWKSTFDGPDQLKLWLTALSTAQSGPAQVPATKAAAKTKPPRKGKQPSQ